MERAQLARHGAWAVAVGSAASVVAGLPLAAVNWRTVGPESVWVVNAIVGLFVPFAGAFLLARRPGHPVGIVLLSSAGLGVAFLGLSWSVYGTAARPGALPGAGWGAWTAQITFVPFLALLTLLPLWFPDGRLPGRGWWVAERLVFVELAGIVLTGAVQPVLADGRVPNPLVTGPAWAGQASAALIFATVVTAAVVRVPSAVLRYRRAGPHERVQLRWFDLTVALTVGSLFVPAPFLASEVLTGAAFVLMAVAITAAVLRHRRHRCRRAPDPGVRHAHSARRVALPRRRRGGRSRAPHGSGADRGRGRRRRLRPAARAVAGGCVPAALRGPARSVRRPDPARRAAGAQPRPRRGARGRSDRGAHGAAGAPRSSGDRRSARRRGRRAPDDPERMETTALLHRGEYVGDLQVAARERDGCLSRRDRDLLADLARPLAAALHSTVLTDQLQRSRERLVGAIEEEHHRLHRDLHDGIGPSLAALVLGLDAVRHAARHADDRQVDDLLDSMKSDVRALIGELRRVDYELRPPARRAGPAGSPRAVRAERPSRQVPRGAGLRSVRERAAELGGDCHVSGRAPSGTIVRATLPVHRE